MKETRGGVGRGLGRVRVRGQERVWGGKRVAGGEGVWQLLRYRTRARVSGGSFLFYGSSTL